MCPATSCSRRDRARAGDDGAELLRLDRRPRRQVLPGDAGREPEVVLDPRAGAGLTADGDGVDRQRAQPLGRGVHRGRQPSRPGTDDDHVVATIRKCVDRHPELLGQLTGRRPLEQTALGDGDRQVGRRDVEPVEEGDDVGVGVGIDPVVGQAVAGGVLAQRHRGRRELRPDDPQRVRRRRHQRRASGEERLEDEIAQPRVGEHP